MEQQLIVCAALIDEQDRVLVSQRREDVRYAGLWEFPGGKVKAGEPLTCAIIRELKEELGVDVTKACLAPLCFVSEYDGDQEYLILLYIIRVWRGVPQSFDSQAIAWHRVMHLMQLEMPKVNHHLIAMLRDIVG